MKFSIIIPVKEVNNYIKESVPYILSLEYPKEEYEIIILPNDFPKRIPKYLIDERIKIIPTGKVSPAVKRDIGANKSRGDILAFIDDDSYPRHDWLTTAHETFSKLSDEFVAVNGPAVTPPNSVGDEKLSGKFFESRMGGGAPHRCIDAGKSFEIDDAPSVNLLVYKKDFLRLGGFGSEYWPGEDSIFCQKIKDDGKKLWYQNNLVIFHHRRDTIIRHLRQVAGYGRHRGNFFRKNIGCSRKTIYLVPSIFLLSIITLLFYSVNLLMLEFLIYVALILYNLYPYKDINVLDIPKIIFLTFMSHLTYGLNFIIGIFKKDIRSRLR